MKKNYFIFKELFEKPITESIYIELVLFIWYFIPSTNGFIIIARVFINNEFPSLKKNIIEKKKYNLLQSSNEFFLNESKLILIVMPLLRDIFQNDTVVLFSMIEYTLLM